jgi:hypothetical protein
VEDYKEDQIELHRKQREKREREKGVGFGWRKGIGWK